MQTGECLNCGAMCSVCESETKCSTCNDGYYVSLLGDCLKCNEICTECVGPSETNCTSCTDGFFWNRGSNKCEECYFGCAVCSQNIC